MKSIIALSLCFLAVTFSSLNGAETGKKTVRLLTIGNSFSRDATRFLPDLVKAGGHELIHDPIIVGGASLELHATKAQKYEASPQDPNGVYRDGKSLKQHLQAGKWDVVTIQQASIKSHDVDTYRPYAKFLYDYVKKHAPDAKVVFHETWAYRVDDPRFSPKNKKPGEPLTQLQMYQGLSNAYRTMAAELGVGVIPTGDAFHLADTDAAWGYQPDKSFDFAQAQSPHLPDQKHSLHVGWRWTKGKDGNTRLSMDGHHASPSGQFLGAAVFYQTLFGDDVTKNTFVPKELTAEDAAYLREIASKAVKAVTP